MTSPSAVRLAPTSAADRLGRVCRRYTTSIPNQIPIEWRGGKVAVVAVVVVVAVAKSEVAAPAGASCGVRCLCGSEIRSCTRPPAPAAAFATSAVAKSEVARARRRQLRYSLPAVAALRLLPRQRDPDSAAPSARPPPARPRQRGRRQATPRQRDPERDRQRGRRRHPRQRGRRRRPPPARPGWRRVARPVSRALVSRTARISWSGSSCRPALPDER
jgi:hypothetical protein